jgi:hypothetical protein
VHNKDRSGLRRVIRRAVHALAALMRPIIQSNWDSRHAERKTNPVRAVFGKRCFGSVDTFPILIRRPKKRAMQKATYQGKYKDHILKTQMIAAHNGRPLFVSGPHIGVRSDIACWRQYGPVLNNAKQETVLGDKAYVSAPGVLSPHKKPRGGGLSDDQLAYNTVLSWYRATVEHLFAQVLLHRFGCV